MDVSHPFVIVVVADDSLAVCQDELIYIHAVEMEAFGYVHDVEP